MSKYVIRNCPCYWHIGEDDGCSLENMKCCEDDTDCIMKQIVELCRKIIFLNGGTDFTDVDMYKHAVGENFVAKQILKLLDIQGVE